MTAYLLTNHVLNLLAPGAFIALLLVLAVRVTGRIFKANRPAAQSIWAQAAILFIVNSMVTVAGLVFFGTDGKMATYAAIVLASGLTCWVLLRNWRN